MALSASDQRGQASLIQSKSLITTVLCLENNVQERSLQADEPDVSTTCLPKGTSTLTSKRPDPFDLFFGFAFVDGKLGRRT